MDVKNDPTSRGYYDNEEMAGHILCECEAHSAYRLEPLTQLESLNLGNCMKSLFIVC